MDRAPMFAGSFYPENSDELITTVTSLIDSTHQARPALLAAVPHAGYVYSGKTAGIVYGQVVIPDKIIILCPKHRHYGERIALYPDGDWVLPTGRVQIDRDLTEQIFLEIPDAKKDTVAHKYEHSLEVNLPFLLQCNPDLSIAAIALAHLDLEECRAVGQGLAKILTDAPDNILIVASTDMSHFISAPEAKKLDGLVIERFQELDPEGLYNTVHKHRISMCGVIPVTVGLFCAAAMGARRGEVLDYTHSGEVTGDHSEVVGYAGMVVWSQQGEKI